MRNKIARKKWWWWPTWQWTENVGKEDGGGG